MRSSWITWVVVDKFDLAVILFFLSTSFLIRDTEKETDRRDISASRGLPTAARGIRCKERFPLGGS